MKKRPGRIYCEQNRIEEKTLLASSVTLTEQVVSGLERPPSEERRRARLDLGDLGEQARLDLDGGEEDERQKKLANVDAQLRVLRKKRKALCA